MGETGAVQAPGRVIWITGGGGGIGGAIARRLATADAEARLALIDRDAAALAAAVERLGLPAERLATETLDVADRAAVAAAAERLLARWGRVDVLVNNAGTSFRERHFRDLSPEQWDAVIAANLTGAYHWVHAVLPAMRAQGGGLIANICSIAGKQAFPVSGPAYTASKHGLVGLSHSINAEEWVHGIRACAICPGEVNTPILRLRPVPLDDAAKARLLQPEDIAEAVAFVAAMPERATVTELIVLPTHRRTVRPEEL